MRAIDLSPGDRILVSRTDRIGDLVLAIPFIESLKLRHPECHVDAIVSDYAAPVLENNPAIDKIISVNRDLIASDNIYRKEIISRLEESSYRAVVVLYPEREISRIFRKAGIPIRIGTIRRFQSINFNKFLFYSRKSGNRHESEYNLEFLKYFAPGRTIIDPHVYIMEDEMRKGRKILDTAGVGAKYIVLHPGSGGSADRWPLGNFIMLYERLKNSGYDSVMTGSLTEGRLIDSESESMGTLLKNICGQTELKVLMAILSKADLVVANSTGPLHLAAATGTKVIGLYPAGKTVSPVRWKPIGSPCRILLPFGQGADMKSITVESVLGQIESLLSVPAESGSRI